MTGAAGQIGLFAPVSYCFRFDVWSWENLCEKRVNTGYSLDGGYAEYAKAYAKYVAKVPQSVDPLDAAPLTCAGADQVQSG